MCHQHQQTHLYCVYWKKDAFSHLKIADLEEDKQPAVLPLLHVDLHCLLATVVVVAVLASSALTCDEF